MRQKRKPIFLFISIAVFLVALSLILTQNLENTNLPGFSLFESQEITQPTEYTIKKPEEVVRQYFESWGRKDWPNVYATLSDGFKRIDLNANDLQSFIKFAESQNIQGVKINRIQIESMTMNGVPVEKDMTGMPNMEAVVDYSVEFTLVDGNKQKFDDKFTLRFKEADIIPGWKLIHPYGQNIDTS